MSVQALAFSAAAKYVGDKIPAPSARAGMLEGTYRASDLMAVGKRHSLGHRLSRQSVDPTLRGIVPLDPFIGSGLFQGDDSRIGPLWTE
jgi:hypothetical protein